MTVEPRTEAGKRLLSASRISGEGDRMVSVIAAIESEARAAALRQVAEKVRAHGWTQTQWREVVTPVLADWRHVPHREIIEWGGGEPPVYGPERCEQDSEPWPCDAEKMRVERDAAIRRAEELERLARKLADEAQAVINEEYREDIDFEPLHRARKAVHAALRSQESQKPPADRTASHADGMAYDPDCSICRERAASEPPETEDRSQPADNEAAE